MLKSVFAICASGPSLRREDIEKLHRNHIPVLAVNNSWQLSPECRCLFSADELWWDKYHQGIPEYIEKWTVSQSAAKKYGLNLMTSGIVGTYNSGMLAVLLARQMGAKTVILLGFDCSVRHGKHWHGPHSGLNNPNRFSTERWKEEFRRLKDETAGHPHIFNCSRESCLNIFPKVSLEEMLVMLWASDCVPQANDSSTYYVPTNKGYKMANKIILSAKPPVALPGGTISFTAKVVDAVNGDAQSGVAVNWSVTPENTGATLGSTSGTSSDTGFVANTVTSADTSALTIIATLEDKTTSSLNVGFSSSALPAPRVPQAKDGVLDGIAVKGTVQAMVVRHTDDPEVGDDYTFYWGSQTLEQLDDGTSDTFPWIINLKKIFSPADVLSDGQYTVFYTVRDLSGNVSYSSPLDLTVTGGTYVDPIYEAPQFLGLTNNTIDYDSIIGNNVITITIPYPQISDGAEIFAGNVISLYQKVYDKDYKNEIIPTRIVTKYTVTDADISGVKIEFPLPKEAISDNKETFDDVRGQFWYSVEGSGSVAVSGTSYTKSLIIDTVPPNFR